MVTTLKPKVDFEYDPRTKRFKYVRGIGRGQFVGQSAVNSLLSSSIESAKDSMVRSVRDLYAGKIELDKFITNAADNLKEIHILQATLAKGGRTDLLNDRDRSNISRRLKEQFTSGVDPDSGQKFGLKYLLQDIVKEQPSEAELANRITMFAESGKISFNESQLESKRAEGATEAKRNLGSGEHCPSCIRYAGLDWQSLEQLILPTQQCECRTQCNCSVEYR